MLIDLTVEYIFHLFWRCLPALAERLLQIFKLMYDVHSLGIVHGDFEPRNIVRKDDGRFLLIDFPESRTHRSKNVLHNMYVTWWFKLIVVPLTDIGVDDPVKE